MVTVKEKTLLLAEREQASEPLLPVILAGPVAPALFPVTAEPAAVSPEAPAVIAVS